ncbi:DUF6311 domain-containing protein [Candidatus Pelagibacter sp.]|jgi:hypothetical protein|nr:DUF6311 domain-containing protein [Candidatus Pelagibacter sp.]|tara:strand:- start:719 stop:2806 length:2088 start_codon:yes stop_codon:yes gene_type:complete
MKSKINFYLISLSLFLGVLITWNILGLSGLSPINVDWISSYDSKSDFLALKFFLNDEWRFPIGLNPKYGDITNSIVFSGAVPFLSFILKLFNSIIPNNFHYFSFWIILCISLQFFFSYKIFYLISKEHFFSFLCGMFFLFSPILYYRLSIHLSLAAHWLILGYIYFEFKNSRNSENYKFFFIILSSLTHFYITIMLLLMRTIFSLNSYFKDHNLKKLFKQNIILIFILSLSMYITGYFVIPSTDSLGFGYGVYKTNLLSFIDPVPHGSLQNWSIVLPDIKNMLGENEGFAYFGLGGLVLFLILIFFLFKNFDKINNNKHYIIMAFVFFLIALSNNINFGNITIMNVSLPKLIYAPLSIIRASGRFIWPIYYLIIIFSLIAFIKLKIKKKYLIIILVLQIVDTSFLFNKDIIKNSNSNYFLFNDKIWKNLDTKPESIYSTYSSDNSNIFSKVSELLIAENFKTTNIFRLGRYDRQEQSIKRTQLYDQLNKKVLNDKAIYFIENQDHLRHLRYRLRNTEHGFFYRSGVWFIIPNQKKLMSISDISELQKVNYLKIEKNNKKNISFKNANSLLGFGWSHGSYGRSIDIDSVWSEGKQSFFIFENPYEKVENLELHIVNVMTNGKDPLILKLFINKVLIKKIEINGNRDHKLYINLKDQLKFGLNIIKFEIENPITPVSKLESVDGRLLGFNLKSYKFE